MAVGWLEESGIRARLADEQTVAMAWHLTNAIGGVKVLVLHRDADAARDVLAGGHDLFVAGDLSSDSITGAEPAADVGADQCEQPDEFALNQREQDADRAWRSVVFGLMFFPLHLYAAYLFLKVFRSEQPLRPACQRRFLMAVLLNFPFLAGTCALIYLLW